MFALFIMESWSNVNTAAYVRRVSAAVRRNTLFLLLCHSLLSLLNDFKCSYSLSSSYLYIHASLALVLSPSFTVWPPVPHSRRPFCMSPNVSVPAYFSFISAYSRRLLPCCQFLSPLFTLLPSLASSPSPLTYVSKCLRPP